MIRAALIFGLGLSLLFACGNVTSDAPCQGAETCQCYPNNTCNGTLSCLSNLCVDASTAGAAGAPTSSRGGAAGEADEAGATGLGSAGSAEEPGVGNEAPASGSLLWLRANAGVIESAGQVSAWLDQSGHGLDGIMDLVSREPALVPGEWNGLPVIRFDGAQSLSLRQAIAPTAFTVFVAGRNRNPTETHSIFLGPAGNTANNQLRWENGSSVLIVGLGNGLPQTVFSFGDTRTFHVLAARYDGANLNVYRNGAQVGSAHFVTTGPWQIGQIGGWFSSDFMVGDLAEILVYERALSAADSELTHSYLLKKYGMR
jgi:hypothetical protein